MITLSVELTKEDLYQYNYYTSWKASWNKSKRIKYYLRNILSGTAILLLLVFIGNSKFSLNFLLLWGVFILLILITIPFWVKYYYKKHVEAFCNNPQNSGFFGRTELTFDEKGILSKDATSETAHSWSAFVRRSETEGYFYLYLNTQLGLVIPKRGLATQIQKKELENIFLKHFPLQAELDNIGK